MIKFLMNLLALLAAKLVRVADVKHRKMSRDHVSAKAAEVQAKLRVVEAKADAAKAKKIAGAING